MKNSDIEKIFKLLKKEVQQFELPLSDSIHLKTKDPFKVLLATILSARTRDELTLKVCDKLFKKVKKPRDLKKISQKELEKLIKPINFYKTKAKRLKKLPEALKEFNNKVPDNINDLVKLPGVGRKTANIVVAVAFKKPAVGVDTHVHKICNRLGYVKTKTPKKTEIALRKKLPKKLWIDFNTVLVMHGQNICRPVSPKCSKCPVEKYCDKVGVKKSR